MSIENFLQYAMKHYDNPGRKTVEEFNEDYQKFVLVKKLLNKDQYNVRLLLNHLVTLYNVFEPHACTRMLFAKIEPERWSDLKTHLVFLNFMPEAISEFGITSSNISLNQKIVQELREL